MSRLPGGGIYQGAGARLDQALLEILSDQDDFKGITRSVIKRWISDGQVLVDGVAALKSGQMLRAGQSISLQDGLELAGDDSEVQPWEFPLDIRYEDDDLLVLDKPAGLSVHPGAGNRDKTLLNAVVAHLGQGAGWLRRGPLMFGALRPGIVHRIDKDTTGLLVLAKNERTHASLTAQFAVRSVGRAYYALAFMPPRSRSVLSQNDSGLIEADIGRNPRERTKMAVLKEGGKPAITQWKVLQRLAWAVLLEVRLRTGRTHQIRVHMEHIGHPLIGDPVYGNRGYCPAELANRVKGFSRQALHAYLLEFDHPASSQRMSFSSRMPADLANLIGQFGGLEPLAD